MKRATARSAKPQDIRRDTQGREVRSFEVRTHRKFVRAALLEWQREDGRDRLHFLANQSVDLPLSVIDATRLRLAHKPDLETGDDE